MAARFRDTGRDSFFGDFIYQQVVPETHFLRQLSEMLDWEKLTEGLADLYKGGAEYGAAPYRPSAVLKMLLLSFMYKLSERETERFASDSLAARYFIGVAANEPVPDHSTLSVFRDRILKNGGVQAYEELFQRLIWVATEKGIKFGRIQVVDATHSIADVDVNKDDARKDKGGKPRDGDASWGTKGKRTVKTADGKTVKVRKSFHGYKAHVSLNAENGIITAVLATTGKRPDGQQFPTLVEKDEAAGINAEVYTGDRSYDDGENHELLGSKGKKSALILNRYRTEKKNGNKAPWIALKASEDYAAGKRERYKIEQKFGEGKRYHGWGRCRYLGLGKYSVQSFLTAITLNLKRMMLLLRGVSLRGTKRALAMA